jgi:hypothetical protein
MQGEDHFHLHPLHPRPFSVAYLSISLLLLCVSWSHPVRFTRSGPVPGSDD